MMNEYKYVVWVGGCDDYYTTYERAKEHYDEWIEQGYDGVHLFTRKMMNEYNNDDYFLQV
jgi:hypothetical protein